MFDVHRTKKEMSFFKKTIFESFKVMASFAPKLKIQIEKPGDVATSSLNFETITPQRGDLNF
jgi:hypothetical protein